MISQELWDKMKDAAAQNNNGSNSLAYAYIAGALRVIATDEDAALLIQALTRKEN